VNHLRWLWAHPAPNGLYNSGTGSPRSFFDLATAVFAALGLPPRISFIDMPADLVRQYQNFTRAETSKLRAAGCAIPATALEIGVTETVRWLEGAGVRAAA
jgi:ADP-L-glycero-D-manno-heptose 6-epimerase